MNENLFKNKLKDALNRQVGICYAIENKIAPGMPDLILEVDGKVVWVECKVDKEPINPRQRIWHVKHSDKRGIVIVARYDNQTESITFSQISIFKFWTHEFSGGPISDEIVEFFKFLGP